MTQIVLCATDYTDHSVTLAIDGTRYEYFLPSNVDVDRVAFLCRRWPGKGLNHAKARAVREQKQL